MFLRGYVDEMKAFARVVYCLALVRVLIGRLLAAGLVFARFRFDFIAGRVRGCFDRLFAFTGLRGEVGILGRLGNTGASSALQSTVEFACAPTNAP